VTDFQIREVAGGITAPAGFRAAGVACGIKASGATDLALIACEEPGTAAGVFTTNLAQAAPVVTSRDHLKRSGGRAAAIVVNSGCANACTGADGVAHARAMVDLTASAVGCQSLNVLVASTGVIGVKLDMSKVGRGIADATRRLSASGGSAAARAIMTTDPFPKESSVEISSRRGTFRVGGIAKGSGMIEPLMATMLGFVTTDVAVEPSVLQRALNTVVNDTFNAITVDGECSTNDCVFTIASGASGVRLDEEDFPLLVSALRAACEPLAIGIVRGGEGATKLITVRVTGAQSDADAKRAARAIANSLLVKTAVHGGDPNWGRLIAVAGRAGVAFSLGGAIVRIGSVELFRDGTPYDERAAAAAEYLKNRDIEIEVNLGTGGRGRSHMWTCDLSAEYVRINADYRT
jgi:glutamate N-acetyltransferase/amino-acid N-acetyltransferase